LFRRLSDRLRRQEVIAVGGSGSGQRSAWEKKMTVEDCHVLSVGVLTEAIRHGPGYSGRVWWTQGEREVASIRYVIDQVGSFLAVRLMYTTTDKRRDEQTESGYPVPLQATFPHYGGTRWWFTCPLTVDGIPCRRRVGKLYLPPNGTYFGCRHCYDLTYNSRQTWDKRLAIYRQHPEALLAAMDACNRFGAPKTRVLSKAIGERVRAQREIVEHAARGELPPRRLRWAVNGYWFLPLPHRRRRLRGAQSA